MSEQLNQFYEEGHLGGCMIGGDPETYHPLIWDFFVKQYNIQSILDIGCGEGHSIEYFINHCKVPLVRGVDGCKGAIENSKIKQFIDWHDFTLENKYDPGQHFDMIWCCEVLEHIEEKYLENLIYTINKATPNYVLITHAFPKQGGYHHVNLQDSSYWINFFNLHGYELDVQKTRMTKRLALVERVISHYSRSGMVFVKKQNPTPKQDAVITWAAGEKFCQQDSLHVFVDSVNSCGFQGDKIVFTNDMTIEAREYFYKNDFQIIDVNPQDVKWIVRDRFLFWYKHLCNSNYRYVILLDSKDVLFQRNPIEYLENTNKSLYFVGEGKKHKDCDWNTTDQKYLQEKTANQDYQDWEVICAGTILGKQEAVKNLIANIWSSTLMRTTCTDQAIYNFLYQNIYKYDSNSIFVNPNDSCLCATADLPLGKQILKDGCVYNSESEKYFLWHQWDRLDYKKEVIAKHKKWSL